MTLSFTEPEVIHPNSDTQTIFEIARILEKKYHICEAFYNENKEFIRTQVKKLVLIQAFNNQQFDRTRHIVEEKIRNKWREFILQNKTKIITKASTLRDDPSFVDTGSYYLSMGIRVVK